MFHGLNSYYRKTRCSYRCLYVEFADSFPATMRHLTERGQGLTEAREWFAVTTQALANWNVRQSLDALDSLVAGMT